jgi:hypothetical protein
MAMTNAEKQANYRKRKIKEGDGERLQAIISLHAKLAIQRLAKHNGITQAALIERLVMNEQKRVTDTLEGDAYRVYIGETVTA